MRSRCCSRKYPNPAIELKQKSPRAYGMKQGYSPPIARAVACSGVCTILTIPNVVSSNVDEVCKKYRLLLENFTH